MKFSNLCVATVTLLALSACVGPAGPQGETGSPGYTGCLLYTSDAADE